MKRDNRIPVEVRIETVWAVGEWYVDALAQQPTLAATMQPDSHRFMRGLLVRKSSPLKLDRTFAKRFVESWRQVFVGQGRSDLLLSWPDPLDREQVEGADALAELVADIQSAISADAWRPVKLDPVETVELVEAKKVSRRRGQTEQATELAAEKLGVSVNTVEKAAKNGRRVISSVRKAIGNAEPLVVLTEDGHSGVAIVSTKKVG
jgi:hypothetical protein